jgi:hypothetical protein
VFIGPKAREVLAPFLKPDRPEAFCFSAAEAEEQWRREKHAARRTPMSCGNVPGSNVRRRPKVEPGSRYRRDSYTRAIARGCDVTFPVLEGMNPEEAESWRKNHRWQ